jgi:glycosyltransferase involved in cell wall biosynthesis
LKVLVIFSAGGIGGAEKNLCKLSKSKSNKINYSFYSLKSDGEIFEYFRELGIEPVNKKITNIPLLRIIELYFFIVSNIDCIYTCGIKASVIARSIKLFKPKIRIINAIRCNLNDNNYKEKIISFIEKKTNKLVDGYISNSSAAINTYSKYLKIPKSKLFLIYNGVSQQERNKILNIKKKYIITIANLSKRKNHMNYLEVLKNFESNDHKYNFLFIGDGPEKIHLQKKIKKDDIKNCELIGFQKNISPYLFASKIFVLPSLYGEGCPTSILEALSFGIPVVAFNIDGINELVENGYNGFLIKKGDYKSFYNSIKYIIDDDKLYSELSLNAFNSSRLFSESNFLNLHDEYFINKTF